MNETVNEINIVLLIICLGNLIFFKYMVYRNKVFSQNRGMISGMGGFNMALITCDLIIAKETGQLLLTIKIKITRLPRRTSFVDHSCYFCLVFVMLLCASVYCCIVVTCWERADLLALACDV